MALKHVLADGTEEDVEGELGQAALAFRAEDRVCLPVINILFIPKTTLLRVPFPTP